MSELTPITRVESYLDAIVNSGIPPTEDITRIETFLQAIYDNQVCALTPITRIEMFLGKISGQDIELPQPVTRVELYLAAIAGEEVELPENPITRLEMYLAEWADSGDWTTISGAIVEFITQRAHKLKSCVVSLSPQQDLHGYDSPWPAGGGVNKCDISNTTHSAYNIGNIPNTLQPSTAYTFSIKGTTTFNSRLYLGNSSDPTRGLVALNSNYLSAGDSEAFTTPADMTDYDVLVIAGSGSGAGNVDISVLKPMISLGSTAPASWSPYSNICPISGWTGCEIPVVGKNLLDPNERANLGNSNIHFYFNNGLLLKAGQAYTFSVSHAAAQLTFIAMDGAVLAVAYSTTSKTYTPSEDVLVKFDVYYTGQYSPPSGGLSEVDCQLELGSTATDYEPYNGDSYSVTFGETVYGATPDLVSGEMPVTYALDILDGTRRFGNNGTLSYGGLQVYYTPSPAKEYGSDLRSDKFNSIPKNFPNPFYMSGRDTNRSIYLNMPSTVTTIQEAKDWFASNPTQILYKLADPIETTITPTPITALKGYNAMWADGGDIEVTVHGTPVEVSTQQALNMLLGGAYHNDQTPEDVSDEEALDIILGGEQR